MGHIITAQGVKVDEQKVQVMLDWMKPTNAFELRGFLGLIRLLPQICPELWIDSDRVRKTGLSAHSPSPNKWCVPGPPP